MDRQLITIRQLLKCGEIWPVDQTPCYVTILRWMRNGCNGQILEHIKTGKTIYTTIEWVRDFLESIKRTNADLEKSETKPERRRHNRSSVGNELAKKILREKYGY